MCFGRGTWDALKPCLAEGGVYMFVLLFIFKLLTHLSYFCDMYDIFHNKFLKQLASTC